METVRTPDERFANLPGYSFAPNYTEISDRDGGRLRVHYLDEGPADAAPIVLLHGEPSWSYLYRKMIPALARSGHRVIAPDMVGFGRSDKPTEQSDYTYERHVAWMSDLLLEHLGLTDATLFGQDWGGLIGLRIVAEHEDCFARVIVGNTGLPTGDNAPSEAFLAWRHFSQTTQTFDVGAIIQSATITELLDGELSAYNAPFPDDTFKAGARIFPTLVPTSPDDSAAPANKAAWEVFRRWEKPFITCFSDSDPVTAGGDRPFRNLVPGAQGQSHVTLAGGGHFLQEDVAPELIDVILSALS